MPTHHRKFVHREAPRHDRLHVVTALSNPQRYHSRYKLFSQFQGHVANTSSVQLSTAELAFGDRPHEAGPCAHHHQHHRFRTWDELWHKENLLNLAIQRLPDDWEYVAWIDADVEFLRADWAQETCHMLQHHHIVQLFETAIDVGPEGEAIATHASFASAFENNTLKPGKVSSRYGFPFHPGYGWAIRREAYEAVRGLLDVGILGSSDHHMAWAIVGQALAATPTGISDGYKREILAWQDRAAALHQDLGFVRGSILHHWHGKKVDRKYASRWQILVDHQFDPNTDLSKDWQGLWQLTPKGERMRRDLRAYFRSRNEDSVDR